MLGVRTLGLVFSLILALAALPVPVLADPLDPGGAPGALTPFYGGEPRPAIAPAATQLFTPMTTAVAPVGGEDHARALDCMSWAIAYEAAGQPIAGQQAVGQVILNRLHHPRRPKTVCGVVFEGAARRTGCQFTFVCDGSFGRRLSSETMLVARTVAEQVLSGAAPDQVGGATHYHANHVLPTWAADGRRVAQIGAHIFYAMPGDAALAPAPVATAGEPDMSAAVPAPRPPRLRRAARQAAARARLVPAVAAPAPGHAMFRPWGLPLGTQQP